MRNFTRVSLALAGSAVLVGSMALPASANTTTTVTVENGGIAITAPATASLGTAVVPGTTVTVDLTGVKVTDDRAGTAVWNATVSSTAFNGAVQSTPGTSDNIIPASAASYTAGTATKTGTATVVAAAKQDNLTTAKTVQSATAVSGNNTATWVGTLALAVPANALVDTYTAVVTHSVS